MSGDQLRTVGGLRPGDHACLVCDREEERRAVVTSFLRTGLRMGDALLYLVDDAASGTPFDRLRALVGHSGADLAAAVDEGLLQALPTPDPGPHVDGPPLAAAFGELITAARRGGRGGVRIAMEASPALRGWPGTERFAAFEDAVARAVHAQGSRATALCGYDPGWFGDGPLRALAGRHDGRVRADDLFDDGVLTIAPLFAPPGLRLSGAIDESTLPALQAALRGLDGHGAHLCIDLSGLEFCDMEGLRTLIEANRTCSVVDRQLVLRAMPAHMELMLRIAGWDAFPDIVRESVR